MNGNQRHDGEAGKPSTWGRMMRPFFASQKTQQLRAQQEADAQLVQMLAGTGALFSFTLHADGVDEFIRLPLTARESLLDELEALEKRLSVNAPFSARVEPAVFVADEGSGEQGQKALWKKIKTKAQKAWAWKGWARFGVAWCATWLGLDLWTHRLGFAGIMFGCLIVALLTGRKNKRTELTQQIEGVNERFSQMVVRACSAELHAQLALLASQMDEDSEEEPETFGRPQIEWALQRATARVERDVLREAIEKRSDRGHKKVSENPDPTAPLNTSAGLPRQGGDHGGSDGVPLRPRARRL